jgi:TetR/AcrR family transcriptional repressor of nem operon
MQTSEQRKHIKPRGRPASFCREELIVEVTDLFWERGYHNLSLNEIAQETGLTRASLYNAFEKKEALFLECIEYYFSISPGVVLETYQTGDKAGTLFYKMFDQICTVRSEDQNNRGCLVVNSISELAVTNKDLAAVLLCMQKSRKENMIHIIKQAITQNELPKETHPATMADIIQAFMSGLSAFSKTGVNKQKLCSMCHVFLQHMGFHR